MTNLIYNITDKPKTIKELLLYAIQQVLAVFVATVLIANLCGTPVDACLLGACFGTLLYQIITKFKSPMFISSCGATVSAVCGALAINATISYPNAASYRTINGVCEALDKEGHVIGQAAANYLYVVIGGFIILVVYALFAFIVKKFGITTLNKIFPPIIVGPITMVIGLNLATFIPSYANVNGAHSNIGIIVGIITMIIVALTSHYFKGFWKTIPFLIGLCAGYIISIIITLCNIAPLVDFSIFKWQFFNVPDITTHYWSFSTLTWSGVGKTTLFFLPVALCALMEHWADHRTLSNIIGVDLTNVPGLHRTLLGDGTASALGTILCGLPNTSYGESIATTGFSRVASTRVITTAALILGTLSFVAPIQMILQSIPSCVFGGCAMILYGYIAASGLKTLINSKADLEDNRNLIIVSVILTVGVSGIWLFNAAFSGVALAMIIGVVLNLILKVKNKD